MDKGFGLLQSKKRATIGLKKGRPSAPDSAILAPAVLHVLDHSWPVLSGYSVRSRNLISAQHHSGEVVRVLTGPLHELDDAKSTDLTLDGVRYLRTPIDKKWARLALDRRLLLAREREVVRLLRDRILTVARAEPVSLIHAHSPALCGLAAVQAAQELGVPCVYEIRAFWEDAAERSNRGSLSLRSRLTRKLETFVAQRADAVAAIAKPMLHDLEARGISREKLCHAPNGVDMSRFSPLPRDERLAAQLGLNNGIVFGFFGSLYGYEGVSWMIQAASRLWTQGGGLHLLIIGRGEDEVAIRQVTAAAGVAESVHIIPHVPHEEIDRYYSVVDVMVYPRFSIRLTELVTPLKPLEAMALAKPVLASAVGGIKELVEDEHTGLLFKPENVESFYQQAKRLIASPELRKSLGERGRQFVMKNRDWKILARRYKEVYAFALQRHEAATTR